MDAGFSQSCGNLQIHPLNGNQGQAPNEDWRALIDWPQDGGEASFLTTRPFPNPVSAGAASITWSIPTGTASAPVGITIFDVAGRVVRTMDLGVQEPGEHAVDWDLRDEDGGAIPSGIYFYRLTVGHETITEKLMVVRK